MLRCDIWLLPVLVRVVILVMTHESLKPLLFNTFLDNVPELFLLKTPENQRCSQWVINREHWPEMGYEENSLENVKLFFDALTHNVPFI